MVKIAEAKPISTIDNNRVRVGNIEAALNDGRGQKKVSLAIDEFRHHVFKFVSVHLSMTDHNPRPGNKVAQFCSDSIDVHHAIVQIKHLALPGKLAVDRIANQPLVVLRDDRLDRQTILRRRFDGAHVARAGEGEIKRPWDGCCAEREQNEHQQ